MSLENRGAQHHQIPGDKFVNPIANYTLRTFDQVVRPAADIETGAIVMTLPPVAEAKGRWYSIIARNADVFNTITIEDNNNDSECWLGDITFNGKCDRALLYSDGLAWHVMANPGSWPGLSTTAPPGTQTPQTDRPTSLAPTTAVQL